MPRAELFVTVRVRHAWVIVGVVYLMGWGIVPSWIGTPLTNWLLKRLIVVGPLRGRR